MIQVLLGSVTVGPSIALFPALTPLAHDFLPYLDATLLWHLLLLSINTCHSL